MLFKRYYSNQHFSQVYLQTSRNEVASLSPCVYKTTLHLKGGNVIRKQTMDRCK